MIRHLAGVLILAVISSSPVLADDVQEELTSRERALTRAIVRHDWAALNGIIAREFVCEVSSPGWNLSLDTRFARYSACTGLGPREIKSSRPDWIDELQNRQPRNAIVEDLEFSIDGGTAVVRSKQSYTGWFPYDGSEVRVARVTDTWVRREGQWVLVKRVSEPSFYQQ